MLHLQYSIIDKAVVYGQVLLLIYPFKLIEKSPMVFVVLPISFCHIPWYSIGRVNTTCANNAGGTANGIGLHNVE